MKRSIPILFAAAALVLAGAGCAQRGPIDEASNIDKAFLDNTNRSIDAYQAATSLDLHGRDLVRVPPDTFKRTDLEVLDLSDNNLTGAIPAEIRLLKNLKSLDLSDNEMTGLPAEVGQLSDLEILDLSGNQLTGLPQELRNLSKLQVLDLSGNPYSETDLEYIRQGLPNARIITE